MFHSFIDVPRLHAMRCDCAKCAPVQPSLKDRLMAIEEMPGDLFALKLGGIASLAIAALMIAIRFIPPLFH